LACYDRAISSTGVGIAAKVDIGTARMDLNASASDLGGPISSSGNIGGFVYNNNPNVSRRMASGALDGDSANLKLNRAPKTGTAVKRTGP
jgi:hypothetical protein